MINQILSRAVNGQPTPTFGMGATILHYSDRDPATIVEVTVLKGITYLEVQEDNAIRTDKNGMSECQDYQFSPNPNGRKYRFRQEKNGMWQYIVYNEETGRWNKKQGASLRIGERDKYYDFSF